MRFKRGVECGFTRTTKVLGASGLQDVLGHITHYKEQHRFDELLVSQFYELALRGLRFRRSDEELAGGVGFVEVDCNLSGIHDRGRIIGDCGASVGEGFQRVGRHTKGFDGLLNIGIFNPSSGKGKVLIAERKAMKL